MENKTIRWFKFESHFGPGHQSTEITYKHAREHLDDDALSEMEQDECDRVATLYETNCSTTMSEIKTLDKAIKDELLESAILLRQYAEDQISALESLT